MEMSSRTLRFGACAVGALVVCAGSVRGAPSFQGIGQLPIGFHPGPPSSQAIRVSDDGSTVVGFSVSISDYGELIKEAFRWTQSTGIVGLGWLGFSGPQSESIAYGTSADGSVVVGYSWQMQNVPEGFRWTQETGMVGLGLLGPSGLKSAAAAVSADGSIIAGTTTSISDEVVAARWTEPTGWVPIGDLAGGSVFATAGGINPDGSVIVGRGTSASGGEAFRWTESGGMVGLGDLPGGTFSSGAGSTSADGSVVVGASNSAAGEEAFRWTQETGMVGLGDLPGGIFRSGANDVSGDGSVIVGSSIGAGGQAFIWTEADGMRPLQNVLANDFGLDLTGWTLESATGVSLDGLTIVGIGRNPEGESEGWIARIPAPATTTLACIGALGLGRRRR